jgi:ABC-2 type transport system permease protein
MSATIFRHEFLSRLRSILIWSVAVAAVLLFFFSLYSGFSDQAALINQMWAKFPPGMRAAFGMDKLDMSTVLGFYGFLLMFVQLFLAIQAGNYGFGLVSVEETELTADFLLTKPVSRSQIYVSKLAAAISALGLTSVIAWAVSLLVVAAFHGTHSYDVGTLWLLMLSFPVFQLFFLAVGLAVSLLVKRVRSVTPYSLGLAFGAYVLGAFSGVLGEVTLELLTPFKHFDPSYIVRNGSWNAPLVLLDVAVSLTTLGLSYWLYLRRDIPAVS